MPVWITLDVGLVKHPKLAALPSDSARYGWIAVLSEAKTQRRPGTFASVSHFKEVMGRHGKYLPQYQAVGLLEANEDGSLVVHDWQRHQWSVTQARHRNDKSMTTEGQEGDNKLDTSRAVSVPVSISVLDGVGGAGEGEPEAPLLQWLAQHGCYVREGNGFHVKLVTAVERHGADTILAAFEKLAKAGVEDGDEGGFIFGAIDMLRKRPDLKAIRAEDEAEEERKQKAAREERNRRQMAYLRGETVQQ